MPNWCENEIEIKGKKESIIELVKFIKSKECDFDFEKVVPFPEGVKPDSEEGYKFRMANWGTKWKLEGASVYTEEESQGEVAKIDFETAWGPSLGITLALSRKFPSLSFTHRFAESGEDFSGCSVFSGGIQIETKRGEYSEYLWHEDDSWIEDDSWEDEDKDNEE